MTGITQLLPQWVWWNPFKFFDIQTYIRSKHLLKWVFNGTCAEWDSQSTYVAYMWCFFLYPLVWKQLDDRWLAVYVTKTTCLLPAQCHTNVLMTVDITSVHSDYGPAGDACFTLQQSNLQAMSTIQVIQAGNANKSEIEVQASHCWFTSVANS